MHAVVLLAIAYEMHFYFLIQLYIFTHSEWYKVVQCKYLLFVILNVCSFVDLMIDLEELQLLTLGVKNTGFDPDLLT